MTRTNVGGLNQTCIALHVLAKNGKPERNKINFDYVEFNCRHLRVFFDEWLFIGTIIYYYQDLFRTIFLLLPNISYK